MKTKFKFDARGRQRLFYAFLKYFSYVCAAIAVAALAYLLYFIFSRGLRYVTWRFIFGEYDTKNPSLRPAIVGTLYLVFISMAIALPIGIFTAIFLTEYKVQHTLLRWIRIAAETLAAIPSIVYGLFGYIVFVVILGWGYSMLGGGITLSVMVLPVIIRTTEEAILAVPKELREASYALGSSKVRTIFRIVLPNAVAGIVSSMILAIGRVISESAVLIMTIGMIMEKVPGMMTGGSSLALSVYYFASFGFPRHAAAAAVVLTMLVLIINLSATLVGRLLSRGKVAAPPKTLFSKLFEMIAKLKKGGRKAKGKDK